MANENNFPMQENLRVTSEADLKSEAGAAVKKPFVEPELSSPIDVLEATTFFQSATSGVTNP